MKTIGSPISIDEISALANCSNEKGEKLCKAVLDVSRKRMTIWAAMHADEEMELLLEGSEQKDLWGINLYPGKYGSDAFLEFDSMINIRPNAWNRSRSVENPDMRGKITKIVHELVR